MNSQKTGSVELFSIDVASHLKKAATHTFGTPEHYPVELVRASLRRGAQRVDIRVGRNNIQVQDNGAGLDDHDLDILTYILDPTTATAEKEGAVEALQTREGLGLLAIFAPQASEILVENNRAETGKTTVLQVHRNQLNISSTKTVKGGNRGTCITLRGKHGDFKREEELLEIFCRCVPASREICLNNRLIGGHPVLTRQLAIIDMAGTALFGEGHMGIPRSGALCRLRLLDQGIPWHHLSMPPQRGFIFEGAVEYTGEAGKITREFMNYLLLYAEQLYEWLCHSFAEAPDHLKVRIEELIFNHYRHTGNLVYLHQFTPFRFYNSPYYTGYDHLKQKAVSGKIYGVPQKKKNLLYNTGPGFAEPVLSLTREQADLLINHLDIPITFLTPVRHRFFRFRWILNRLKTKLQEIVPLVLPVPTKIVEGTNMSLEEAFFMRTLNHYLEEHGVPFQGHAGWVKAVLVASWFPYPTARIKSAAIPGSSERLDGVLYLVRRHHPLVREAVTAVRNDRENIELFIPLLQKK